MRLKLVKGHTSCSISLPTIFNSQSIRVHTPNIWTMFLTIPSQLLPFLVCEVWGKKIWLRRDLSLRKKGEGEGLDLVGQGLPTKDNWRPIRLRKHRLLYSGLQWYHWCWSNNMLLSVLSWPVGLCLSTT